MLQHHFFRKKLGSKNNNARGRAIGDEAYDRMKEASKTLLEIAKREEILQKKEAAIEPLYAAARAENGMITNVNNQKKDLIIRILVIK